VTKLRDSRWKSQEEEEQAEQKATVEEEAKEKEKEQGKITGRVTRRLLSIMSSRLETELVVSGREARGSQRERATATGRESNGGTETRAGQRERARGDHWASHQKVAPYWFHSSSEKALG
jgi:hypothetical protein